jgi:hypothetical protein
MSLRSVISIGNDLTAADIAIHDEMLPPSAVTVPMPCQELDTQIYNPPAMYSGQNKLTSTVRHCGIAIAQAKHDVGRQIPHITLGPLAPIVTELSSRKAMFSSSKVRTERAEIAACLGTTWFALERTALSLAGVLPVPYALTPMLACSDPVPLPCRGVHTSVGKNTVTFGLTVGDMLAGWADILWEAAVEAAASYAAEKVAEAVGGPVGKVVGKVVGPMIRQTLGNVKSGAVGAYQWHFTDGPVEIEWDLAHPWLQAHFQQKLSLSRDAEGTVRAERSIRVGEDTYGVEITDWERARVTHEHREHNPGHSTTHEEDGKRTTYTSSDDPSEHGRVTVEDVEG